MADIPETHVYLAADPDAGLQARLRQALSQAIWDGRFAPGDRLPATRALARHLGVARVTVALAYEALADDGWLRARPRSGYFIAAEAPSRRQIADRPASSASDRRAPATLDWAARLGPAPPALGLQAKPADWRRYRYPFVFGKPDVAAFPLDDWRACVRQAMGRRHFDDVADDAGDRDDPMLVAQIVARSISGRGVSATPDQVLVTAGAQNALWLAAQVLLGGPLGAKAGPVAAIEEPGWPELRHMLIRMGVTVAPMPVDAQGLVVDALPPQARAVFVTPSHQSPTGATMSMPRRAALLRWADAHDAVVVEDDYDFEMHHERPHAPALKSLDAQERVIYVGSFSKSLFPGLRLGYLTAPAAVIAHARALRTVTARHPPGVMQRATAHFLALGHYNAHARALRRRMATRRRLLAQALAEGGLPAQALAEGGLPAQALAEGGLPTACPADAEPGGAALWVAGPPRLDTDRLAQALRDDGVLIEPGAGFFAAPSPPRNAMRLGVSAIEDSRIAQGAALICDAVRRQLRG